jgi:hypothetical protein
MFGKHKPMAENDGDRAIKASQQSKTSEKSQQEDGDTARSCGDDINLDDLRADDNEFSDWSIEYKQNPTATSNICFNFTNEFSSKKSNSEAAISEKVDISESRVSYSL